MSDEELRIDLDEAKEKIDSGQAIIVDVVAPHTWQDMHKAIAGAIRIDPDEIGQHYRELPINKEIIVYCT